MPSVTAPSFIRPRVCTVPHFGSSAGREAVELAASVGLHLDPWQAFALEQGLGEAANGTWSAFEVCTIVGRQNGKGSILEARELAGLFLFDEQLILHSAHQFKTAAEGFRRILTLIENTDWMRKRVKTVTRSHGDEGVELTTGQRLRFVARSRSSGRGFTGDCVILDEAFNLNAEDMAALLPTLAARPNPQVWYASSAGMATSTQLAAVRERGLTGDETLAYLEWSAEPGADLDDRAAWAAANPAMGIRIPTEFIARERAALPDAEFARERLGIWAPTGGNAVIDVAAWHACADEDSTPLDPVVFAVDVGPDAASSAISVCGMNAAGLHHVETVATGSGMSWVEPRLVELAEKWSPAGVVIDAKSAGASLIDRLTAAGHNVVVTNADQLANACALFQTAVIDATLRHRDESSLNLALANAKRRPLGERWAWTRKGSSHDITPLVAATLALFGFIELEPGNYEVADSIY